MGTLTTQHQVPPLVSVVLAVRNEARFIEDAVRSLLRQRTDGFDIEVLVVDGASTDTTKEIVLRVARDDGRVRLVENVRQRTPFAFNIGIREARGEYVCIFGSHATYDPDYIAVCLRDLIANEAVGCSGQLDTRPADGSAQATLVAAVLRHPFGSSDSSVRTQTEGFVDTIPYPIFRRQALLEVSGYDEELYRNQDNDINQRLRARGYKLFLTSKTRASYYGKAKVGSLIRYAFTSGYWNLISFRKNPSSMAVRHFIPFAFATYIIAAAMIATGAIRGNWLWAGPLLLALAAHGLAGVAAALQVCVQKRRLTPILLPAVFLSFHMAYGLGTFWAVMKNAKATERPRLRAQELA